MKPGMPVATNVGAVGAILRIRLRSRASPDGAGTATKVATNAKVRGKKNITRAVSVPVTVTASDVGATLPVIVIPSGMNVPPLATETAAVAAAGIPETSGALGAALAIEANGTVIEGTVKNAPWPGEGGRAATCPDRITSPGAAASRTSKEHGAGGSDLGNTNVVGVAAVDTTVSGEPVEGGRGLIVPLNGGKPAL
jgi:hypothetical protein